MLKFCFPKRSRLLYSKQYRFVNRQGIQRVGRFLRIKICIAPRSCQKLGITVSRHFGKATERNRFKRLVREAFRLSRHKLPPHIHVNVRPMDPALNTSMQIIQQELISLIEEATC